jgi:D-aspartate ligase
MHQGKIPAIILDSNERSQEGIVQALGRRQIPIVALSKDKKCVAFRSRYVSEFRTSPDVRDAPESYIEFLLSLPVRGVLIYSHDISAVVISENQDRLRAAGYLLNISPHRVLLSLFDKWACYQQARSVDIPVAKTMLVECADDVHRVWSTLEKPVIVKPTRRAGGRYPRMYNESEAQLTFETLKGELVTGTGSDRDSHIVLQEWIDHRMDDLWCSETVRTEDGESLGVFSIRKIRANIFKDGAMGSRLLAGEHVPSDELRDLTERLLSSVGWRSFAHLDWILCRKRKRFYLCEVNPRLPGFSYFPGNAGFDMAFLYYADLTKTPFDRPERYPTSIYFEALRFPGDLSHGIYNVLRGELGFRSFVGSYMRLLTPGIVRIVDPIRIDDPIFTVTHLLRSGRDFLRAAGNYIVRRILRRVSRLRDAIRQGRQEGERSEE